MRLDKRLTSFLVAVSVNEYMYVDAASRIFGSL